MYRKHSPLIFNDGLIYPTVCNPVKKQFARCGEKDCWIFTIKDEEYEHCRYPHMWSSSKPGEYGSGLLNTEEDRYKTERTSRLGELAFAKAFPGLGVDVSYKKGGEAVDFKMGGLTIDIKTAATNYGCNCVQVRNSKGYDLALKSDIYVGSFILIDAYLADPPFAEVVLVGWQWRDYLASRPLVQPRSQVEDKSGTWLNRELKFEDLKPMIDLRKCYDQSVAIAQQMS